MKKTFQAIYVLLTFAGMAMVGCTDDLGITSVYRPSDVISFTATLGTPTVSGTSRSSSGHLAIEEEEWQLEGMVTEDSLKSRGSLTTSLSGQAGVIGIPSKSGVVNFSFNGDEMTSPGNPVYWKDISNADFSIYAYAPHDVTTVDATNKTITYQVADEVANQKDVIVASRSIVYNTDKNKTIPLTFDHILTAVRFKLAIDGATLQSIIVSGVNNKGVYTMTTGLWSEQEKISVTNAADISYTINSTEAGNELLMIPQTLPNGAKVTLNYEVGGVQKTLKADLIGEWQPGKLITYTLYEGSAPQYIYLDLAAGNVTIGQDEYSGAYYEEMTDGTLKLEEKKDQGYDWDSDNDGIPDVVFYVYQSTEITRGNKKGIINKTGKFISSGYSPVKRNKGQLWRDYIINNEDVNAVIENWVTDVADAGREGTKNRIHVDAASNTSYKLVIDNVYSIYQLKGTNSEIQNRKVGGISFYPIGEGNANCKLTITTIGDNRLGNIHYATGDIDYGSKIIFEGEGSLTVADVNLTITGKAAGLSSSHLNGYFGNYYCSAIGGNDSGGDHEKCLGIVINSGVLFAGSTVEENCSAIGGGGNGIGGVTINGGVVTAVASTTGTAIGGGIGYSSPGGEGIVTIKGGNVYAYNLDNLRSIPSSAIGGAGSSKSTGTIGTVTIEGGYVYAYSALGTAIGGGSSRTKVGGEATVTIKGGTVIAKTGSRSSASIGGGTGNSGGIIYGEGHDLQNNNVSRNGGDATVTINGGIIRTGSIGGGGTGREEDNIGNATITITGGDIQAQCILAAGSGGTPSFEMTGGVLRNSNVIYTPGAEYLYVMEEGGAVYLEDGTCNISGANTRISNCTATKGGAIYIKGNAKANGTYTASFTMSNGTIEKCTSTTDGGAVYLTGGDITLTGGTIQDNLAQDGNGGGFFLMEGSFTMSNATISNNSAIYRSSRQGNGGGVYVTSSDAAQNNVNINIASGTITGNTSDRLGGGICVQMPGKIDDEGNVVIDRLADIEIGDTSAGPYISGNNAIMKGGGLYVEGAGAFNVAAGTGSFYGYNTRITINNGTINGNSTTAYVPNDDVVNEKGVVILNGGDVPSVNVTFDGNGGTTEGNNPYVQRIVTATNNILIVPEFKYTGNDLVEVKSWNTRADGEGDDEDENGVPYMEYAKGRAINLSKDLKLYAIWGQK